MIYAYSKWLIIVQIRACHLPGAKPSPTSKPYVTDKAQRTIYCKIRMLKKKFFLGHFGRWLDEVNLAYINTHTHMYTLCKINMFYSASATHRVKYIHAFQSFVLWWKIKSYLFITREFYPKPHKRHPIARPWGASYGVSFVSSWSDLYPTFLIVTLYTI